MFTYSMCIHFPLENQIVAHLFLPKIEVSPSHIPNEEIVAIILIDQDLSGIVGDDDLIFI